MSQPSTGGGVAFATGSATGLSFDELVGPIFDDVDEVVGQPGHAPGARIATLPRPAAARPGAHRPTVLPLPSTPPTAYLPPHPADGLAAPRLAADPLPQPAPPAVQLPPPFSPPAAAVPPRSTRPAGRIGSSRGAVYAGRAAIWLVVVVIILNGLIRIVTSPPDVNIDTIAGKVRGKITLADYPLEAAQGFATRFVYAYLTVDPRPGGADLRARELAGFTLVDSTDGAADPLAAPMRSTRGQRVVVAFPAGDPVDAAPHVAVVTVAAKLDTGEWRYVAVPVYADPDSGGLSLAGAPAFTSPPIKVAVPPLRGRRPGDDPELGDLLRTRLSNFFPAWAASDQAALPNTVLPGKVLVGLGGGLRFVRIVDVHVPLAEDPTAEADRRVATVTVTWQLSSGAQLDQQYRVTVVRERVGGNPAYYVADIAAGSLSATGSRTPDGVQGSVVAPNAKNPNSAPVSVPRGSAPAKKTR